jgi:putative transposase
MKKKRFSVERMIGVLKQAQVAVPVAEAIRQDDGARFGSA